MSKTVQDHISTFGDLDFNVFTNQAWDQLSRSHAKYIVVHWPDGSTTNGIEPHIDQMKQLFVYAPDTRVTGHPVMFGTGEWTCVIGEMQGTFTKPMPTGDGKSIAPTGKSFKIQTCTVARWNKEGTMDEEWLFWDTSSYMKQLGLDQ